MAFQKEEVMVTLGLDSSKIEAQGTIAGNAIERTLAKSTRALNKLFAVNLVAIGQQAITDIVDFASKSFAEMFYGLDEKANKLENDRVSGQSKFWSDLYKSKKADEKTLAEIQQANFEKSLSLAKKLELSQEKVKQLRDETESADRLRKYTPVTNLPADFEVRLLEKKIALAKEEGRLSELELQMMHRQKSEESDKLERQQKIIDAQNKINQGKRDKLKPLLEGGAHTGELSEIDRLQQDADLSDRLGNRSRAATDRKIAGALSRDLQNRLNKEIQSKETSQDRMIKQIMDLIAPIKGDGVPVKVVNLDNK